jgi:hypothetical protein
MLKDLDLIWRKYCMADSLKAIWAEVGKDYIESVSGIYGDQIGIPRGDMEHFKEWEELEGVEQLAFLLYLAQNPKDLAEAQQAIRDKNPEEDED